MRLAPSLSQVAPPAIDIVGIGPAVSNGCICTCACMNQSTYTYSLDMYSDSAVTQLWQLVSLAPWLSYQVHFR